MVAILDVNKPRPKFLYVVSRDRAGLFERLSMEFADMPEIGVVIDRRDPNAPAQGRVTERRVLIHDLETLGWALVPQRVEGSDPT